MTDKKQDAKAAPADQVPSKAQAVDVAKLVADAVAGLDIPKLVTDAVAALNVSGLVDAAIASHAERAAEAAAEGERAEQDDIAEAQRRTNAATKKAESALRKSEGEAAANRAKLASRAQREHQELLASPVASGAAIDNADSIELRLGDGSTFLPGFAVDDLTAANFADDAGRPTFADEIVVPVDAPPMTASIAVLLVEKSGEPIAVYCSEIMDLPVGGGRLAVIPAGSLAFRRLSPA